jgi:flagellar biosynthesis chaperone FliJ
MNTIATKLDFSNGMQSLENILNKIEELATNPEFIKSSLEVSKKVGITANEWNQNKVAILYKFASDIILGK